MLNNNKILIIAYFFPPLGGGGVLRTVKYIKYLSRKGWDVTVLTAKPIERFVNDNELIHEIPDNVTIHRTNTIPVSNALNLLNKFNLGWLRAIVQKWIVPDLQIGWLIPGYFMAQKIIKEQKIEKIYSTSSPITAHFIGFLLKKKYKTAINWVADFRDPWSLNLLIYNFLGSTRKQLDAKIEKYLLKKCDHIVVTTETNRKNLINKFKIKQNKVFTITNGYDEDDFQNIDLDIERTKKNHFKITYTGSAYGIYNPSFFINSILPLLKNERNIKVYFIGECSQWVHQYLIANGLYDQFISQFVLVDYVPYKQSLCYLQESDLLLLILPEGAEAIIPGKTFEYLRSNVPVIANVPPAGEVAKIILKTKTGEVVGPLDNENIYSIVKARFNQWNMDKIQYFPNREKIKEFRRDLLTDKLINNVLN